MLAWCAARGPEGVLQPDCQCGEALATEHHLGVLPAGEGQAEVVEAVFERHACDGNAEVARIGEVGQALLPGRVVLAEDYLPLGPMQRLLLADAALEGATDAGVEVGMTPQHLLEHGDGAQARGGLQHGDDLGLPD